MSADGAHLGSLCSDDDMAAVPAFPNLDLALGKDFLSLDVLEECSVTLFVMLLDSTYHTELSCKSRESFFLSGLGKAFIHIGPLKVLAVSCSCEVSSSIADTVKFLEPELCVLLFVVSSLKEECGNLLEAFLLCL